MVRRPREAFVRVPPSFYKIVLQITIFLRHFSPSKAFRAAGAGVLKLRLHKPTHACYSC